MLGYLDPLGCWICGVGSRILGLAFWVTVLHLWFRFLQGLWEGGTLNLVVYGGLYGAIGATYE